MEQEQEEIKINNSQNQEETFVPSTKVYEGSDEIKKKYVFNTIEEKIQEAQRLKQEGNDFFRNKDYQNALKCYSKVILFMNGLVTKQDPMYQYSNRSENLINDEELAKTVEDLQQTTFLNMSQIDLYKQNYKKAIDRASKSLKIKETAKGYYRRGCAYLNLNDLDNAQQDFSKVTLLDPGFTQINQQLEILKKKQKQQDQQLKAKFKNMFQ